METKNPYASEKRHDWEMPYNYLLNMIKELKTDSSVNNILLMAMYSKLTGKSVDEISKEIEVLRKQVESPSP